GREGPLDRDAHREGERDRRLVQICRKIVTLLPAGAGHADQFAWERPEVMWGQDEASRVQDMAEVLLDVDDAELARVGPVEAGPGPGRGRGGAAVAAGGPAPPGGGGGGGGPGRPGGGRGGVGRRRPGRGP